MGRFYYETPAPVSDDDLIGAAVLAMIEAWDEGKNPGQVIGAGLAGGVDRPKSAHRVAKAIPLVFNALLTHSPVPYATLNDYKAGLAGASVPGVGNAVRLLILGQVDQTAWWTSLKLRLGAANFQEVKDKWGS